MYMKHDFIGSQKSDPPRDKVSSPRRGDCWYVDLGETVGNVMYKTRPCIVISHDGDNRTSNCVTVVPITSTFHPNATHTCVDYSRFSGTVVTEQIRVIDKRQLCMYLGCLTLEDMQNVDRAVMYHLFGKDAENLHFRPNAA